MQVSRRLEWLHYKKWSATGFACRRFLVLVLWKLNSQYLQFAICQRIIKARDCSLTGKCSAVGHEMDDTLSALREALGFHTGDPSQEQICKPYIEYIKSSWTGRGEQQDFLRFFIEVVRHCRGTSIFDLFHQRLRP